MSQKQPVILQIIPELGPGGAEQGCIDVAAELIKSGAKALVASHGGSRLHELTRAKATHIHLPVHSKNPLTIWKNIKRLKDVITREKVDIVHVRSRAPAWSAYYACKQTKTHFMTTFHAPYNFEGRLKKAYNAIMARGQRIIAISAFVQDYIKHNYDVDSTIVRLIHRGTNIQKFDPSNVTPERMIKLTNQWRLPAEAKIILLPGRLTRWKGHHFLLQALEQLQDKDVFCVLVGSDQGRSKYRTELEEFITNKNLGEQVRLVDHCDDMPAAYMLSNVVVSASIEPEGFGRIPIEAQAMGRPIIGTNHGGARETILKGETGWLVPPKDANSMAVALREALSLDADQRKLLASKARKHVEENFTVEIMCSKTLDVYAEFFADQPA